ncbi:MAG: glycosyl hydrolase [Thermomicrobiales bacterium]|nr:glycosyl hydrolase [Thermomicrobiales bacterium]
MAEQFEGLLKWRSIGPFRGGRVVAVHGVYDDPNTFYFGGVGGGVWKSTDAGQFWVNVSDGFFKTSAVGALAVAKSDSNVIYAGTGETTIRIDVTHGDGVYKSTDAGVTWKNVGLNDTRFIGKVRVHPNDPDTVWVAALGHAFGPNEERGVFKSTDGGETWRKVLYVSDKSGAVDLTVDEKNPRVLYATIWEAYRSFWQISSGGPESGIWRSLDGGETWEEITRNQGLPDGTLGKIAVTASPAKTGRVWALIEHNKKGGMYRSDDYGVTWTKTSDNQNLLSRAWYYTHATADPADADTVYVNNLDFFKSTDGGKTFFSIPTPHGDNHDLWIDPADNRRMIQGNDGGANVSLNGGYSWSSIFNQPTSQFYHLGTDNKEPYTIYGTQQDNSSIGIPSANNHGAISWQDVKLAGTGESGYIQVDPTDDDIVFVGAVGSSPGGGNSLQRYDRKTDDIRLVTSWPEVHTGIGAGEWKQRFAWTYPIHFSPHDPKTIYIGGERVYKTTNEGQTWTPISPDLTRHDPETLKVSGGPVNVDAVGAETYATIYAFIESPHEKGVFWAGSDDGYIHISKDNGKTWDKVTPPQFPDFTMVSGIEASPFDKATVYVAATRYKLDDYEPYLFVTRDYGQSWERIDNGIERDHFTRVIRADATTPGLLFAGTEVGLYVSFDDGKHWERFQLNLPVSPIHEILIKGTDLIAGTHGRAIWILDDVSPLRQVAAGIGQGDHLFAPRVTTRVMPGIDWSSGNNEYLSYMTTRTGAFLETKDTDGAVTRRYLDAGANPPRGAIITYRLAEAADPASPITLTFKKGDTVIRSFTSRTEEDETFPKELRAGGKAGWNRFVWDLRWAPATKIQGTDPASEQVVAGPLVSPGSYSVTLKVGDKEYTHPLEIKKPKNVQSTKADLEAQEDLLLRIHRQVDTTVKSINQVRDLRTQLDGWSKRTKDQPGLEGLSDQANALRDKVLEIEKLLLVPDLRAGWADTNNAGLRLLTKLASLTGAVELGDYRPTDAAEEVYADLSGKIEAQLEALDAALQGDVSLFNQALSKAGLTGVLSVSE